MGVSNIIQYVLAILRSERNTVVEVNSTLQEVETSCHISLYMYLQQGQLFILIRTDHCSKYNNKEGTPLILLPFLP